MSGGGRQVSKGKEAWGTPHIGAVRMEEGSRKGGYGQSSRPPGVSKEGLLAARSP